jgi:hypothetical protein
MIVFRHADPSLPFLWGDAAQPAARWHGPGEGPANYFADTPDGAWAELLRHEEISDPADIVTIRRAMWAVEIGNEACATPSLPLATLTGGPDTCKDCRAEARRLRDAGATRISALSAALLPGAAGGLIVDGQMRLGEPRRSQAKAGRTIVLFGTQPSVTGWRAAHEGRPAVELAGHVRYYNR